MDPIIAQNLLAKARAQKNGEGGSLAGNAVDSAKEMIKQEVKRQAIIWALSILGALIPYILVMAFVFFLWYAGCTNMGGTIKGWGMSSIMQGMGICPF